jgi:16S rRNA (cytosine967-C5)-methyltransferase
MFFLDRIPDRAAVNESVEYVRKKGFSNAVSFTNGILRQIARRSQYFKKPDKEQFPVEYLALQFSHPEWIVERWLKRFKFDRMEEMLASNNKQPPMTIRINSLKTPLNEGHNFQKELLKNEKVKSERTSLKGCFTLTGTPNLDADSMFGAGHYTVQDLSSQLIGYLVSPQEHETIIDTCCGPGGKLSHIYELGEGKVNLIGIEKNPSQMEKAQSNMARLGHENLTWVQKDFLKYTPETAPDKILLDSPCSGLGVLKRHPEGKWHKDLSLVFAMSELQKKFIQHALDILKPGGTLIYSVCSFEIEESDDQMNWVKKTFGDKIEIISPVTLLPDYFKKYVTRNNILSVFSGNKDKSDGFSSFIVKKIK